MRSVGLEVGVDLQAGKAGLEPHAFAAVADLVAVHGGAQLADDAVVDGLSGQGRASRAEGDADAPAAAQRHQLLHLAHVGGAYDGLRHDVEIRGVSRVDLAPQAVVEYLVLVEYAAEG